MEIGMLSDKHRMDTVREYLAITKDSISRVDGFSSDVQKNDTLYVAILKAKDASGHLLDLDSCELPKSCIKHVLVVIDKLALAMSEANKTRALNSASEELKLAIEELPKIY